MSRTEHRTDRAAQWVLAQQEADWGDDDQAAFDAWLAESDGNRTAYLRMRHSWKEADRIGALSRSRATPAPLRTYRPMRWHVPTAIAASIALVIGGGYVAMRRPASTTEQVAATNYDTKVGGQRLVGLSDGSKIQLNTASKVKASIRPDKREVWIDQGEAFFEVSRLDGKPFIVHAGNRQVTVLGTKFSVRRDGDKVTVTVLEGRVKVEQLIDGQPVHSSVIVGGNIAFANGQSTLVTARSEQRVEDALAWRQGMLSFGQANLGEIATEFNRYNDKKLIVIDADARNIRIGGMFPSRDPDSFIELLRNAYGLKIQETADEVRIAS